MFTNQLYIFIVRLILLIPERIKLLVDKIEYSFEIKQMNSFILF